MDKVPIICLKHGLFEQTWDNHINSKQGCPKCAGIGLSLEEKIFQANEIHNHKYDYSKLPNKFAPHDKITIICPIHGEFKQMWDDHINKGAGCLKCAGFKLSLEEKITQAHHIHGRKYDYSKLPNDFLFKDKVSIGCYVHGYFKQMWDNHINDKNGCPLCKSSKGETSIRRFLVENNQIFTNQKSLDGCINPKTNRKLFFDFYLPEHNLCIEYDGAQHYKSVDFFGGVKEFTDIQYKDNIKNEFCKNNNIGLLRISYKDKNNILSILEHNLIK